MDAFKGFEVHFRTPFQIPDEEWAYFTSCIKLKNLEKNQTYFEPGDNFQEIGFVAQGLLYTYFLNEAGEETVKNFSWEGRLASSYGSILEKKPTHLGARALEPSILLTLSYEQLLKLYERHRCWERLGRKHAEQLYVDRERREVELLLLDTHSRYEEFCKHYSPIVERIPQYMIASYLGVTPVALSRNISKTRSSPVQKDTFPA
ncbi:Crp/Fnr family transcriptional regulator [bacterium]|nr:Crp/Fnr family transcriptional regulator [bacterium]